jgi:hypothetical protein
MNYRFIPSHRVVLFSLGTECSIEKAVPRSESCFGPICEAHACHKDSIYEDRTSEFNSRTQSWTFEASSESGAYLPGVLTLEIRVLETATR